MQVPLFPSPNIAPLKNVGHIPYLKHTFNIGNSNLGGLLCIKGKYLVYIIAVFRDRYTQFYTITSL